MSHLIECPTILLISNSVVNEGPKSCWLKKVLSFIKENNYVAIFKLCLTFHECWKKRCNIVFGEEPDTRISNNEITAIIEKVTHVTKLEIQI